MNKALMLFELVPSLPVVVWEEVSEKFTDAPDGIVQFTVAPGTGLPFASVTNTIMGSNRSIGMVHVAQANCPFPDTTEIAAGVCCASAEYESDAHASTATKKALRSLIKTNLQLRE